MRYIHGIWGKPENEDFYHEAITHYGAQLPRFFVLCLAGEIVGCGALIVNDFVSRHDLWPWYACHYIAPQHRGKELGSQLLSYGTQTARQLGFKSVYLYTDLDGYYERYGWLRIEDAHDPWGGSGRVYTYRFA